MFNIWTDYSETKAIRILNSELADSLGNLLNRCSGKTVNPDQIFPKFCQHSFSIYCNSDEALKLVESLSALPGKWPPCCMPADFQISGLSICLCGLFIVLNIPTHFQKCRDLGTKFSSFVSLSNNQCDEWNGGGERKVMQ